jgi:glutathione S-transferase
MSNVYTLYGAPFSMYTGKARAYLRYKNIPYEEVLSTIKVYKRIIVPNTGVRFIPVVKTPDEQYIQDTAEIIDTIEKQHPQRPVYPVTAKQRIVTQLFELYGDEWLLLPAMHYRWNKDNEDYIYANFGSVVLPGWPAFIRKFVGRKVGNKFKGFVPLLGITEQTIPAIEQWYENELLPLLDAHFAQHDYLLGGAASVGDFGLMGALYAHLYMDPYPGQLMRAKAAHVEAWVERMNKTPDNLGQWLNDDAIPETLLPILRLLFRDHWPVVQNTLSAFTTWSKQNPTTTIPRIIGKHAFSIGEVEGSKGITSFTVWKYQRILEQFTALSVDEKEAVNCFLTSLGAAKPFYNPPFPLVKRENNQLVMTHFHRG